MADEIAGGASAAEIAAGPPAAETAAMTPSGWGNFVTRDDAHMDDANRATTEVKTGEQGAAPTGEQKPAADAAAKPATDAAEDLAALSPEDQAAVRGALAAAKAAGHPSIAAHNAALMTEQARAEAARGQQTEQQKWEQATFDKLRANYQARIDAGELTDEQATELFRRDFALAKTDRTLQSNDLTRRQEQITHETTRAVESEPLLGVGNGEAALLIGSLATAGLTDVKGATHLITSLVKAVEQKAVADYIAAQAEKNKNAAPVVNAGAAPPNASAGVQAAPQHQSWGDKLLARSFGGQRTA